MSSTALGQGMRVVVLDTNIVLDLFLFQDPRTVVLREQLHSGELIWRATAHMRNELERVLTYAHIVAKLSFYKKSPQDILAAFDQFAQITPEPSAKAPYTCKDTDDQPFIDLACDIAGCSASHIAGQVNSAVSALRPKIQLISKDKAVLCMRKRLEKLSVIVTMTF